VKRALNQVLSKSLKRTDPTETSSLLVVIQEIRFEFIRQEKLANRFDLHLRMRLSRDKSTG